MSMVKEVWTHPLERPYDPGPMYRLGLLFVLFLAAAAAVATPVSAAIGTPTARWGFDETSGTVAVDAAGSMDGTILGASPVADGQVGHAFRFDGEDRVSIPDAATQRGSMVVIDLWVRSASPTDGQVLIDKGSMLCGGSGYALVVDGKYVTGHYRDLRANTGVQVVRAASTVILDTLWDGEWHHVTMLINNRSDGYGGMSLRIDGWWYTSSAYAQSEGVDYGDAGGEPLEIGGAADGCAPGFVGDIDQVRLYDRIVLEEDLIQDEPRLESTLTIDSIAPDAVSKRSTVDVTLSPSQGRPGRLRVYVTADDGVERGVGALELLYHWQLHDDGRYRVNWQGDYGGESLLRVRFEPTSPSPALPSEDTAPVTIPKKVTRTNIDFEQVNVADEPIRIAANVTQGNTPPTGDVQVWEKTAGGMVLVGTGQGNFETDLPGRPAGTYRFEGRFLGDARHLPSTSALTDVVVLPGLTPGEVKINGGADVTDDPIVTVAVPAIGATALWISTDPNDPMDPQRFFTQPYASEITTWLTAPWFGDDGDGVRTVWVRWADALGRWSDFYSDTIVLDRGVEAGTIQIANGADVVTSGEVVVAVPIDDASDVDAVHLSNDGVAWTGFDYSSSLPWTLAPGDGVRTVYARWQDSNGRTSPVQADTIVVDATAPSVSRPAIRFAGGASVTGSVPIRVTWSGSDLGLGIARYEIQQRIDAGAWVSLSTIWGSTSMDRAAWTARAYTFRVRAVDRAGNVGAWQTSPARRFTAYQESSPSLTYTGRWTTASSAAYWGGGLRAASGSGRSVSLRRTAYGFAWVAPVGPTRGSARVYVNGTYVATVSLYAKSGRGSRVVFEKTWGTNATRTITIRVSGTAGHPRVDLDGLIALN